jgi:hypothetical protein
VEQADFSVDTFSKTQKATKNDDMLCARARRTDAKQKHFPRTVSRLLAFACY